MTGKEPAVQVWPAEAANYRRLEAESGLSLTAEVEVAVRGLRIAPSELLSEYNRKRRKQR